MLKSHNNIKLTPLNQDDFEMEILEDLGTMYPNKTSKNKSRYAIFQCNQCDRTPKIMVHHAKKNKTSICPFCANSNVKKIHGFSKHKLYDTYKHMVDRCYNNDSERYKDYGGRGIIISSDLYNLSSYIKYVENLPNAYKDRHSVDRIDNDGNYEIGNLRWASLEVQARNTRRLCKSNTSGYRGVSFDRIKNNWKAQIVVNRVWITIGNFNEAKEAGLAYDKYVLDNNLEHTINNVTPKLPR